MNLMNNYENNHNNSFELISVTSHSSPSPPSPSSSSSSTTLSSLVRSSSTGVECTVIPSLKHFEQFYASYHAYLACIICLFGTGTNLLNAIVLTQKQMHNPTNTLLTGIAIVDSLKMLGYGLQVIYLHFMTSPYPDKYPHSQLAVHLILIHHMLSIGSHTISTCLLVQLAIYRCWILYSNKLKDVLKLKRQSMRKWLMISSKKRFIIYCYISAGLLGSVLCLPTFIIYQCELINITTTLEGYNDNNHSVNVSHNNTGTNVTDNQQLLYYWFKLRNTSGQTLERVHFILYGCFVKILASILIVIFTIFILIVLHEARKRYKKLQQLPIEIHINDDNNNNNSNNTHNMNTNNTTNKNNNGDQMVMITMKEASKNHHTHLQVNNTITPDHKSINNNNNNTLIMRIMTTVYTDPTRIN
ncbi:unnamed protein product [Trichobilharzia szidati]|nr:unnamed protein product [Trichobilharzia szidati]